MLPEDEVPVELGEDEIIREIRKYRQDHAASLGGDLQRIYEDIKQREIQSGRQVVRLPPKKPDSAPDTAA